MKNRFSLLNMYIRYILSPRFILRSALFSLIYFLLSFSIYNFSMIRNIIFLPYSFETKITVLLYSFVGYFNSSSHLTSYTVLMIALLFGVNTAFLIDQSSSLIRNRNRSRITFSAGFISLASAGCAACGLSVVSLLGIGGAFAVLPWHGAELSIAAIVILSAATLVNLKSLKNSCAIPLKSSS